MNRLDEVLKHATLAVHDVECTSLIVLMVCNGEPELHLAVSSPDIHKMNTSIDLAKLELFKLINDNTEEKGERN